MSTNEKGTPQSRTYTVNDIAAILGIGRATAYKLANSGLFKTIRIGNNKMISIVQTGCKYVVVSIGKDEVHFLCELTEEELLEKISEEPDTLIPMNDTFQKIFDKFKG